MARKRNVAGIFISIAVIAVIIVATILTLQSAFNSENAGAVADTTVADTFAVIHVTDHPVTVSAGPSNMRQYAYTGELVDTLGALPNGMGIAKFEGDNTNPAATYKGNFVDGVCQDQTGEAIGMKVNTSLPMAAILPVLSKTAYPITALGVTLKAW